MITVKPGRYRSAVMECNGQRLQTGWFRTEPPNDMLEWAIARIASQSRRDVRLLYLVNAIVRDRTKPVETVHSSAR